jgi:hypothetical protein
VKWFQLIGFGIAIDELDEERDWAGIELYMPSELLTQKEYNNIVDIFYIPTSLSFLLYLSHLSYPIYKQNFLISFF